MKKPKINIKPDKFDYMLETIALFELIYLISFPIYYFLEVPKLYAPFGQYEFFIGRRVVLFLPIIGLILYIGFSILKNYPNIFNYPIEVTVENAKKVYKKGIIVIRLLKIAVMFLLAYLNYKLVEIGLGRLQNMPELLLPVILIVSISFIIFSIIWIRK